MTSSLLGTVLQFLDRIARTVHVDAVYCYRPSSVVCLSVGRSVTLVSPAKAAEPIEMPFGLSDGPKESCIRWGDIPMRRGNY